MEEEKSENFTKSKQDRKKFNFMKSFYEAVETLPKRDRPKIYEAIIKYSFEDDYIPDFTGTLATVWILIQPILDTSYKQYKNGSQNGAKD